MDGLALSALVSAVTKAAASEAGKNAWQGLMELCRRILGRSPDTENTLQKARADRDGATDLAAELYQVACRDPQVLQALRQWVATATEPTQGHTVNNVNHGGTVGLQAGHVSGGSVVINRSNGPINTGSGSQFNLGGS